MPYQTVGPHGWAAYARPGLRPTTDEPSYIVSLPRRYSYCAVAAVIVAGGGLTLGDSNSVPPPETSTSSAADVSSGREGVAGNPLELSKANAFRLMDANLVSSETTVYGYVTARYPSPVVNVSLVPLRAKLQALLMLLYSQYGDVDAAFLEAKLQALLRLPDSVLAQLMEHPDLADLNKMLDAVFLGTINLSGVKTELDKIDVTLLTSTGLSGLSSRTERYLHRKCPAR